MRTDAKTLAAMTDAVRMIRTALPPRALPHALHDDLVKCLRRVDATLFVERIEGVPRVTVLKLTDELREIASRVRAIDR
jgi:hypothetical protein